MPKKDGELSDEELEQVVGGSKDMKILLESWRRFLNEEESSRRTVIFMAGAPGSGKTTVIKKLGLDNIEMINPDSFYEPELERLGKTDELFKGYGKNIEKMKQDYVDARDILARELINIGSLEEPMGEEKKISHTDILAAYETTVQQGNSTPELDRAREAYDQPRQRVERVGTLFAQAQKDAKAKQAALAAEEKSFIIDGTAGRFAVIKNQKEKLEKSLYKYIDENGEEVYTPKSTKDGQTGELVRRPYETAMIFVDVPLDVALARQLKRGLEDGRTLDTDAVTKSWTAVTKNLKPYQKLFGNNFFLVSGDEEQSGLRIKRMKGKVNRFLTI